MKSIVKNLFLLCLVACLSAPWVASAASYDVDLSHSTILARIKHLGTAHVWGRFNQFEGKVNFDPASEAGNSVEFTVRTESIDTGNERRDNHLRSPDFFNAKQFPVATFKSKQFRSTGSDRYEVTGNLMLAGTTREVTAIFTKTGEGRNREGKALLGFDAEFTVNRNDFGITYGPGALGDEVLVMVSLELVESS